MQQEPVSGIDDSTAVAGLAPWTRQLAVVIDDPTAMASPAADTSPAITELLALIHQDLELPAPDDDQGGPRLAGGSLFLLGDVMPEQLPTAEPDYNITPLGLAAPAMLGLAEGDLFGAVIAAPLGSPASLPDLFRGLTVGFGQTPLFEGSSGGAVLPKTPGDFQTGLITLFGGETELELKSSLAATFADASGQLTIEGDGDDLVLLPASWQVASLEPDTQGYAHYFDTSTGVSIAVRNVEVVHL